MRISDHDPDKPRSLEEAANIVGKMEDKVKDRVALRSEFEKQETIVNTMSWQDREKFLQYAINLCEKANRKMYCALLRMKIYLGQPQFDRWSNEEKNLLIAKNLSAITNSRITPEQIKAKELEALKFVHDTIAGIREKNIPILGEPGLDV